jgi:hypothetical protein
MRDMSKRFSVRAVGAGVLLIVGVAACSANKPTVSASTLSAGATASSKPSVVPGASTTTVVGPALGVPGESLLEHYTKLGVDPTVAKCYTDELTKLGVKSVDQLETDQDLATKAAQVFDTCVAASKPSTSAP